MDANTKSKITHFAMLFVVMTGAVIAGNFVWQYINKPTVMPPASSATAAS